MSRVALVTGAARGMGAATALRLAEEGYEVLALDACAGPTAHPYPMPTVDDLEPLLTKRGVSHYLGVSERTVDRLVAAGRLTEWDTPPLWDGHAGARIAKVLASSVGATRRGDA